MQGYWSHGDEGPPLHLHAAVNAMVTGMSFLAPHTPNLHDPERALAHLTRASELDERLGGVNQWRILEHLAIAQHFAADASAATSLKRGLDLVPERAEDSIRVRFRERIAEYDAAAAKQERE